MKFTDRSHYYYKGDKRMIVDYDKEIDMVYISKRVDNRWIQVGLTNSEVEQIIEARKKE